MVSLCYLPTKMQVGELDLQNPVYAKRHYTAPDVHKASKTCSAVIKAMIEYSDGKIFPNPSLVFLM
jgi:hypothetical protein